ncbi:MAG: succinylglutamate desuccinylase/aspartoacylase family protein [Patescibacteria group bacterium]
MKKILVIGGLHGNEPLGVALVRSLIASPLPNIDAVFGSEEAIKKNVRFVESDLNRVFPGRMDGNLEERRAAELMERVKDYDIVLDFHNTNAPNNDCGFVGGDQYETLLATATTLGLTRVIVADYDCINKYVPTCISVETSLSSKNNSVEYWRTKISGLVQDDKKQTEPPTLYRFARRVTSEEQNKNQFRWSVFEPISSPDQQALGLAPDTYYPIFVDDAYTPQNYAGLIIEKN